MNEAHAQNAERAGTQRLAHELRALWGGQWTARDLRRAACIHGRSAVSVGAIATSHDALQAARAVLRSIELAHGTPERQLVHRDPHWLALARAGSSDKWSVTFDQVAGGLPVEDAFATILFDASGHVLMLESAAIAGLDDAAVGSLRSKVSVTAEQARSLAAAAFTREFGANPTELGVARLVLRRSDRGMRPSCDLVWAVDVASVGESLERSDSVSLRIDARTGVVLANLPRSWSSDVSGTVKSWATPGVTPDVATNPETLEPMPGMSVTSSSGAVTTRSNGSFTIVGATPPIDVTVKYSGAFVNVLNTPTGTEYQLTTTLTQGSANVIEMNRLRTEAQTAQANAFLWVNRVREWIRGIDATDTTPNFVASAQVNRTSGFGNLVCNGAASGVSIIFGAGNVSCSGGNCTNKANSTVVAHEYGHLLNARYNPVTLSGQFHEGAADAWALYCTDQAWFGVQWCDSLTFLRTGENTQPYCGDPNLGGCTAPSHTGGMVLMGALWKSRQALKSSLGASAGAQAADALFLGWLQAFDDGEILADIWLHWLLLDDDNGVLSDGTPNRSAIDTGFVAHGFYPVP